MSGKLDAQRTGAAIYRVVLVITTASQRSMYRDLVSESKHFAVHMH